MNFSPHHPSRLGGHFLQGSSKNFGNGAKGFRNPMTLQNLFDPQHPEFNAAPARSEFERSVFLKLLWRPL